MPRRLKPEKKEKNIMHLNGRSTNFKVIASLETVKCGLKSNRFTHLNLMLKSLESTLHMLITIIFMWTI